MLPAFQAMMTRVFCRTAEYLTADDSPQITPELCLAD
jgi:hypothetical protein